MGMIMVTGGAGFIGSNVAARLAERADVAVCDLPLEAGDLRAINLAKRKLAAFVLPDELFDFLARHDVEAVVHMGAISATTELDMELITRTNITLSRLLWSWCAEKRLPLVYASSAATYGDGGEGFVDDNTFKANERLVPLNAYGWSKKAFDLYALRSAAAGRAPPVWSGLKFFNVYGPNEQHKGGQKSVVAHMYPAAMSGEPVTLFRSHNPNYLDGGQLRDFIYVKDCAAVIDWLLRNGIQGGILNVGAGQARSFADLAKALFAALGRTPEINYIDTPEAIRARYQYFTEADMRRLRALGYGAPFTSIEDGVRDYVTNYLGANDSNV